MSAEDRGKTIKKQSQKRLRELKKNDGMISN